MKRTVLTVAASALMLSGCATLFADKTDTVTINSEPAGAEVYEGATLLGKTPLTHTFRRTSVAQRKLRIKATGYATHELGLSKDIEPVAFLNFGFISTTMGATSWGIDYSSGAMFRIEPSSYFVDLQAAGKKQSYRDRKRRERIQFVLRNRHSLSRDIAQGNGPYLTSYYQLAETDASYDAFRTHVQHSAVALLSEGDGIGLYRRLDELLPSRR